MGHKDEMTHWSHSNLNLRSTMDLYKNDDRQVPQLSLGKLSFNDKEVKSLKREKNKTIHT